MANAMRFFVFLLGLQSLSFRVSTGLSSKCLPTCCDEGFDLDSSYQCSPSIVLDDPSSKRRNLHEEDDDDSCPHQSFYPDCASGDPPNQTHLTSDQEVTSTAVTGSLGRFDLKLKKETISTFFNIGWKRRNRPGRVSEEKLGTIPASFCVSKVKDSMSGRRRALVCPKVEMDKPKLHKCCPFGENLKFPLGKRVACESLDRKPSSHWNVRMNGYAVPFTELIQFPYMNLVQEVSRERLACARDRNPLFDYEAFKVNQTGTLVYTRLLDPGNKNVIDDFCIDSTVVHMRKGKVIPQALLERGEVTPDSSLNLMLAVFCPISERSTGVRVRHDLLTIRPPNNAADPIRLKTLLVPVNVLLAVSFMTSRASSHF